MLLFLPPTCSDIFLVPSLPWPNPASRDEVGRCLRSAPLRTCLDSGVGLVERTAGGPQWAQVGRGVEKALLVSLAR